MRYLVLPTLLLACGKADNDPDTSADSGAISAEDQRAADLWAELEGYSEWQQHEDWMGVSASEDGTHGAFVQIWMNDLAADAIAAGDGADMPEGAILVKEGYGSEDGAANGITVMAKESGWGDDGWFWAKYAGDGSGSVQLAGSVNGCTGCHSGGQDSVLFVTW